jgi:hypothetical protein
MTAQQIRNYGLFFAFSLLLLSGLFYFVIPLLRLSPENFAFDWRESFYGAIWRENFGWESHPFRVPPWSIPFFIPLTALPFNVGWAIMMAVTTLSLVLVVPRFPKTVQRAGLLLLFTAYPVIRNYADVNLEAYVLLGLMLSFAAFQKQNPYLLALGVLLATIKPQNVSLMMLVMGLYILQTFTRRNILIFGGIVGTVVFASLLVWGRAWYTSLTTTVPGVSLSATFESLSLPSSLALILQIGIGLITLFVVLRGNKEISKLKAGLLIAASIIIAPYTNLTSLVSMLAFGGIALLQKRFWLGVFVFLLADAPYLYRLSLVPFDLDSSLSITIIMTITWFILLIVFYQDEIQPKETRVLTGD